MIKSLLALIRTGNLFNAVLQQSSCPLVTRALAQSKATNLTIFDLQHGNIQISHLHDLLSTNKSLKKHSLCRVASYEDIGRALDLGADGIIVTQVESERDAEEIVSLCKYPPEGVRSFGPIQPLDENDTPVSYARKQNDTIPVLVMIENESAFVNLESILKVSGIDGIFVGPTDLSLSLGLSDDKDFFKVVKHMSNMAHEHDKLFGYHTWPSLTQDDVQDLKPQLVSIATDLQCLTSNISDLAGRYGVSLTPTMKQVSESSKLRSIPSQTIKRRFSTSESFHSFENPSFDFPGTGSLSSLSYASDTDALPILTPSQMDQKAWREECRAWADAIEQFDSYGDE